MGRNTWMSLGASVVAAGILMLGAAFVTSGPASAGLAPTPTATATATTVQIVRTSTPKVTSTAVPQTATPVPPTVASPSTSTPRPSAGNEGVNVKPPNTGSGASGSASGDLSVWLLVLGAASVAAGGAAVFAGVRRH
jgi:hypothetical protein